MTHCRTCAKVQGKMLEMEVLRLAVLVRMEGHGDNVKSVGRDFEIVMHCKLCKTRERFTFDVLLLQTLNEMLNVSNLQERGDAYLNLKDEWK